MTGTVPAPQAEAVSVEELIARHETLRKANNFNDAALFHAETIDALLALGRAQAALAAIRAMCPENDPGPAQDPVWGNWNSEGNYDDVAYDAKREALWEVAKVCDGAVPAYAALRTLSAENQCLAAEVARRDNVLAEMRRAIGDHWAPNDCYATGPLTGNDLRDLVECPACSAIAMFDNLFGAALAPAKTGGIG